MASSIHPNCTTLVLVCGHALFRSDLPSADPLEEASWSLKPFQASGTFTNPQHGPFSKQGEHLTFCEHILAGLRALDDPNALLVFSGGVTDRSFPLSEAETYRAAMLRLIEGGGQGVTPTMLEGERWVLEDKATDSFQNLLFSIIRFRHGTGRWPEQIKVVTHEFKRKRFLECHAKAIRWPDDDIEVIGIDPVWSCMHEQTEAQKLEEKHALVPFSADPYGMLPPLSSKRTTRGWQASALKHMVEGLEREVQALLDWDKTALFKGPLPWDRQRTS